MKSKTARHLAAVDVTHKFLLLSWSRAIKLVGISLLTILLVLSASAPIPFSHVNASPTPPTSAYSWSQVSQSVSPSARISPNIAFDAANNDLVLFGGTSSSGVLGDTWIFNGISWAQLSLATSPSPREGAAMVYDAADGYLLLFGGGASLTGGAQYHDTWIFKNGAWTQLSTPTSPPARMYASMTYDATDHEVVLFGGASGGSCFGGCTYYSDTWTFKAGVWTQIFPSSAPKARAGAGMTYDNNDAEVLLFGGTTQFCCSNAGLGDTWKFVAGSWTQLTPSKSPSERNTFSMSYDPTLKGVLVFGGWIPAGACGSDATDTWEFSAGSWTQLSPVASPSGRQGAGIVYDPLSGGDILFGGQVNSGASPASGCGNPLNQADTWTFGTSQILVNLITWKSNDIDNGWSTLQQNLNVVNEISIFHVIPLSNGSFSYDSQGNGAYLQKLISQVLQKAQANNVKVTLAVGGYAGCSPTPCVSQMTKNIKTILNSPTLRNTFATSLASEVQKRGYAGIQWDLENNSPGDFNATEYMLLIASARHLMPTAEFDCVWAPWMSSVNVSALAPYCNHFLYGFPDMSKNERSTSNLAYWAQQVGGPGRLSVGYDLEPTDGSNYYVPTPPNLASMKASGYGIMFFEASRMNQTLYNEISADFVN
jgi:Glycosyl hydrolases family 18/Kelch motif/Galactose oxidase, central domain